MRSKTVVVWVLAGLLNGCATSRQVTFTSSPPEADVYVNGTFIGQTPVSREVICDQRQVVRFDRAGYVSFEQDIPTQRGFNESNPVITWIETRCAPGVHVPLRAEKK